MTTDYHYKKIYRLIELKMYVKIIEFIILILLPHIERQLILAFSVTLPFIYF